MGMGMGIKIGEFARLTGISDDSLRRLDVSGKLIAKHTSGGHRLYDQSQLEEALKFVRKMKLLPTGKNIIVSGIDDLDDFFAYLLGLIFADGNVNADGQVQLEMKDKQIMEDVAAVLGAKIHPRPDRPMWRMTIPKSMSLQLVEHGVCRRKSKGFDIQPMSERSFGPFLRGLFDGDGSVMRRHGGVTLRVCGHPRAMAHIQATLLGHYGLYMAWVADNRMESGMLEIGKKSVVDAIYDIMYKVNGVYLKRKQQVFIK